jgi:hypothetical protein
MRLGSLDNLKKKNFYLTNDSVKKILGQNPWMKMRSQIKKEIF